MTARRIPAIPAIPAILAIPATIVIPAKAGIQLDPRLRGGDVQ